MKKQMSKQIRVACSAITVAIFSFLAIASTEEENEGNDGSGVNTDTKFEMNQPAKIGHIEWKLTEVRTGKIFSDSDGFTEVKVGSDETTLVWVFGTVTNRSNEEDFTLGDLKLVDSKGIKYGENADAIMLAEGLILDSFNPNVPKKFSTIFEVPTSALHGLSFQATDFGAWSEKTGLINLGLQQGH